MYQYGAEIGGCCSRVRRTVWIRDLVEGPVELIGEPITTGKQPSKSHHRLVKVDDSIINLKKNRTYPCVKDLLNNRRTRHAVRLLDMGGGHPTHQFQPAKFRLWELHRHEGVTGQ
jgi:hypothetical protein